MNEPFDNFDHPILDDKQMADLKIQPGEYSFECIEVIPKVSKSGNKMLQLKFKIFDMHKQHIMVDFLVATENMAYKIKNFWESVGKPENYKKNNHWMEYLGKCGYCSVKPQKNRENGKIENRIVDYIVKNQEEIQHFLNKKEAEKNTLFEDNMPLPF